MHSLLTCCCEAMDFCCMKRVSAMKAKLPALSSCVRLSLQLDLCMQGCIICQLRRCVTHHDGYLFCLRLQSHGSQGSFSLGHVYCTSVNQTVRVQHHNPGSLLPAASGPESFVQSGCAGTSSSAQVCAQEHSPACGQSGLRWWVGFPAATNFLASSP